MKIRKLLLKLGEKLAKKKEKDTKTDQTKESLQSQEWNCWWFFYKPKMPKIFKK